MADQEKLNGADTVCHLIEVLRNLVAQRCTLSNFLLSNKKCGPHNICILHYWSYQCLISALPVPYDVFLKLYKQLQKYIIIQVNKSRLFSYRPKHGWLSRLLQRFAGENLNNNQR